MSDRAAQDPGKSLLLEHQRRWAGKPVLAELYRRQLYERITVSRMNGWPDVELGGGGGFYKSFAPQTISTDIISTEWLDLACDATSLPFGDASIANLVAVDLLHHLARPSSLFDEARRVLKPSGRLILVEPWITPGAWLLYRFVHHEECRLDVDPFDDAAPTAKDPHSGSVAMPWRVFGRGLSRFQRRWPELRVRRVELFSCWCWLLSGGFQPVCLLPGPLLAPLLAVEETTTRLWRRRLALRALIVFERRERT